jgi:hypothetical protein
VHRQAIVGQRWAWATTMARRASAAFFSVSSNSMGAHPPFQPVTDWTEVQIDRLDATKDPLHRAPGFVGSHGRGIVERFNRKAGADDLDAVGCSLGGDLGAPPREVEGSISDIEIEMLGHCVIIGHAAELKRDLGGAAQAAALAGNGGLDAGKIAFGRCEQLLAFAGALRGEIGFAADDEAFAGEVGGRDAAHIALIKQGTL